MSGRHVDPDDVEQWSEPARRQLADAARALTVAVRGHRRALDSMTGRPVELPRLFEANAALARALLGYREAISQCSGTTPRFWSRLDDDVDLGWDDDETDDDEDFAVVRIAVLRRRDYAVIDYDAVIAAGRRAYLREWPEHDDEDAAFVVDGIGPALAEVAGAEQSWDGLAELPGLESRYGAAWVVDADQLPELDDTDPEADSFALPADVVRSPLHRSGEVYL